MKFKPALEGQLGRDQVGVEEDPPRDILEGQFTHLFQISYHFKYDLDHQTATGADTDIFAVEQIRKADFEPIATRAWVVIDLEGPIVGHILDFDLVVKVFRHIFRFLF